MVSFKLGKDIEENFVPLFTSVGQRQILEPQTFGFRAPILSVALRAPAVLMSLKNSHVLINTKLHAKSLLPRLFALILLTTNTIYTTILRPLALQHWRHF